MGILKKMWKEMGEEEDRLVNNAILAHQIAEEDKRNHTYKVCKRIFSEGYPYQRTMFGNPKSYVCMTCAKNRGLIK